MNKYFKLFALWIAMLFLPIISYANSQLSTSSTANVQSIPAQDKLDAFLVKVAGMRQSLNDDTKYKSLLTQIEQQLQTLWERYKSNTTISQMIAYLNSGITNIKREFGENKDMDDFFCALLGNCWESSPITDIEKTTKGGNTSSWSFKWSRAWLVYIQSDENGAHTNGNTPVRNTQLDSVRYPFTSIECPTGFERMWIWMRKENNGKNNYQVFTCVKTTEANLNSFGANEPHSSILETAATQTVPANNGGYNNDYIEPEQVYIPFSDLKLDNAKLNFPDRMYILVPGLLEPAHREEYIEYYRNYYFN